MGFWHLLSIPKDASAEHKGKRKEEVVPEEVSTLCQDETNLCSGHTCTQRDLSFSLFPWSEWAIGLQENWGEISELSAGSIYACMKSLNTAPRAHLHQHPISTNREQQKIWDIPQKNEQGQNYLLPQQTQAASASPPPRHFSSQSCLTATKRPNNDHEPGWPSLTCACPHFWNGAIGASTANTALPLWGDIQTSEQLSTCLKVRFLCILYHGEEGQQQGFNSSIPHLLQARSSSRRWVKNIQIILRT